MAVDTDRLLQVLLDAGFEFVVIGGTAALAHGAATPTKDLDVAAPLTPENLERLLVALKPFRPHHATRRDLGVVWQTAAELAKFRLLLLDTDLGRLDVLGTVEPLGASSSSKPSSWRSSLGVRFEFSRSISSSKSRLTCDGRRTRSSKPSCGRFASSETRSERSRLGGVERDGVGFRPPPPSWYPGPNVRP